ncbi:MAG: transporter substrate-binding domain-containing protein [Hyphomicrobiales bacterium]|nr:transporter substrate-binding domain-containing protein [Hyphomicrobiales bacterium]
MIRTILIAAAFAALTTTSTLAQQALRIGVEGNYPPFSSISPDGKLSGFDIDIANAVCAELKASCTLVQQEWDGMLPALNARKFDMIVASMTITEERLKAVDFSNPYYDVPSRWVGKVGSFPDVKPETLKGKKIIVLRNSPRARFVQDNYKDSEILLVAKETDVYMELAAGRGDIAVGSSVVSSEGFLKKPEGKGYGQIGDTFRIGTGGGVGIAVRKTDGDLKARINEALKTIRANGTYKAMAAKYFDFDIFGS